MARRAFRVAVAVAASLAVAETARAQAPPPAPVVPSSAPPAPSLRAADAVVAPGGRIRLVIGAGPEGVTLQERTPAANWRTALVLPTAVASRTVSVRAPLSTRRVTFRLALAQRRGTARQVVVRPLSLASVGDVNLGDVPGAQILRYGAAWPWRWVGPTLRAADLAFANLECAVSVRGAPQVKQFTFRGRPSSLRAAATAGGLDVVNLANNHAVDYGRNALLDTLRTARSAGIAPVGAGADAAQAYRPVIVQRLGLRVAFVGFEQILPFEFRAGPSTPGTAWAFPSSVRASVRRARREADVVVATFHWGIERAATENASQRSLARLALSSGADAVIGAHPHVLQPVRRVGARQVIAYSLGNFVFGAHSPHTATTRILTLGLAADGVRSVHSTPAHIVGGRPILDKGTRP